MLSHMDQLKQLESAGLELSRKLECLSFAAPVAYVYNPFAYAWQAYAQYLSRYSEGRKRVVFMGMNPGPFGMVQTGIAFGEIAAVRDWLKLDAPVGKPIPEHPKRPVLGLDCPRSEVSGRRLWGLFRERFGSPERFFSDHFVINYCPLAFMADTGKNLTPDKLPSAESEVLFQLCDDHLRSCVAALQPDWLIGVGKFAEGRARLALEGIGVKIGTILHPSPASPAANKDWAGSATHQLKALGIW